MRGKDDLFHLIKAMSKSEKRYFSLDARKSGREGSRYLEIFQAINKMEEYDESKLQKKFPKNLSSDKGYLYEAILRSMRDYQSSKSKSVQIKEKMIDSRYLYERGLYDQSEERLKEARNLVVELEDQFVLLEISKEQQLIKRGSVKSFSKDYIAHLKELNKERKKNLKAVLEEVKYLDLYHQLSLQVLSEYDLKDSESKEALKKQSSLELLNEENIPISSHAEWRYFQCNALYAQLLGDSNKVVHYFSKVVEWWDAHPKFKKEEFHRYVVDVSNLINTCFKSIDYRHRVPELLTKLENENPQNFHEQRIVFQSISLSKLLYFFSKNDLIGAKNFVPEIEEGLKKFSSRQDIVLSINICILFFVLKEYDNSFKWSDWTIKTLKTTKRQDIQRFIRILNLISLYELDDFDKLESSFRSFERYFKKQMLQRNSYELTLIKFLKEINNAALLDVKNVFIQFKNYLLELQNQPENRNKIGLEELLLWLEEKL